MSLPPLRKLSFISFNQLPDGHCSSAVIWLLGCTFRSCCGLISCLQWGFSQVGLGKSAGSALRAHALSEVRPCCPCVYLEATQPRDDNSAGCSKVFV